MFVIPMAGESRRFAEAGYDVPKYQLRAHGDSVFAHAVRSFINYFSLESFLFIFRDVQGTGNFLRSECDRLKIRNARYIALDLMTKGQGETVALGLDRAGVPDNEPITIFNIDTVRLDFIHPEIDCNGYLEVFVGEGDAYSFVRPDAERTGLVAETSEKRPISNLCSNGLYHFRRAGDFRWAYAHPMPPKGDAERRERYVAPLYNSLISRGDRIGFRLVDRSQLISFGTPEEFATAQSSDEIACLLANSSARSSRGVHAV